MLDVLSRIASKEAQMRDMFGAYMDATGPNAEATYNKLEKLATRVKAEYTRAEEWSAQKRELAHALWRKVCMAVRMLLTSRCMRIISDSQRILSL